MSIEQHLHYLLENSHEADVNATYYIEPQVLTALEKSRFFAVSFLKGLSPSDMLDALNDLKNILKLGEENLCPANDVDNINSEVKDLVYDDFQTLKFVFENHIEAACRINLKTSLSTHQFYCLLALWSYANAYKFIEKTSLSTSIPEVHLKLSLNAACLALVSNNITALVYDQLFSDIAQERIQNLEHKSLRQSIGGVKGTESRYGSADERAARKDITIKKIIKLSLEVKKQNRYFSWEEVKSKVAKKLNLSKSTINTHIPKYATQLKNLSS